MILGKALVCISLELYRFDASSKWCYLVNDVVNGSFLTCRIHLCNFTPLNVKVITVCTIKSIPLTLVCCLFIKRGRNMWNIIASGNRSWSHLFSVFWLYWFTSILLIKSYITRQHCHEEIYKSDTVWFCCIVIFAVFTQHVFNWEVRKLETSII